MNKRFYLSVIGLLLAWYSHAQQLDFLVKPYLQGMTSDQVTILWESTVPSSGTVDFGEARWDVEQAVLDRTEHTAGSGYLHQVTLRNLKPETNYFYQVTIISERGDTLRTPVWPLLTAVEKGSPFAFVAFSDSQDNPDVWGRLSSLAFGERPNFGIHAGDLVGMGFRKEQWVNDFFGPSHALMRQVPLFTVPGNHEYDSPLYYGYFPHPDPAYPYQIDYGDASLFFIDTNRPTATGDDGYRWLEHALATSTAKWKFVVQHHPPYSSEENDHGDTHYEKSHHGDVAIRSLVPLYEKYGVDIVFYGHVHMYERTWPIAEGKPTTDRGVIYMNIGGSGGRLERSAPTRTPFLAKSRTTHHFVYVAVHGHQLHLQAMDDKGQVFDYFQLSKAPQDLPDLPAPPYQKSSDVTFADRALVDLKAASASDTLFFRIIPEGTNDKQEFSIYKGPFFLEQTAQVAAFSKNTMGQSEVITLQYRKVKALKAHQAPADRKSGLRYTYYEGTMVDPRQPLHQHLRPVSEGTIAHPGFQGIPNRGTDWGVVYQGYLEIPETGPYELIGHAYNVLRISVHDSLVLDTYERDGDGKAEVDGRSVLFLEKGLHPIRIEYYLERKPTNFMHLGIRAGDDKQVKPISDYRFFY